MGMEESSLETHSKFCSSLTTWAWVHSWVPFCKHDGSFHSERLLWGCRGLSVWSYFFYPTSPAKECRFPELPGLGLDYMSCLLIQKPQCICYYLSNGTKCSYHQNRKLIHRHPFCSSPQNRELIHKHPFISSLSLRIYIFNTIKVTPTY